MARFREHYGRRHQHESFDVRRVLRSRQNRKRAAEAGSDERRGAAALQVGAELGEHARERQRRKIGLVEVGGAQLDVVLAESLGEVPDLRRLRRRRKAVKVDDLHKSAWQSGRQRHLMSPSPSVL